MQALLRLIWNICWLRKGPQDLPAAALLTGILLAVDLVVGVFLGVAKVSVGQALLESAVSVAVMLLFVQLVLRFRGCAARFNQTVSAMAGCDALLGSVLIPLLVMLKSAVLSPLLFANFWLLLLIWIIVITAHIFRHALAISFVSGILLSVVYFFLQMGINHFVFVAKA